MSGAALALGIANGLETILLQPSRAIVSSVDLGSTDSFTLSFALGGGQGTLIPDCAIEERHVDRLVLTQHPVERSAAITDHVYKVPPEVTLRWAWTNSPSLFTNGQLLSIRGPGFVQQVYQELLTLQTSGVPCSVFTGKRAYQDMMLTSLQVMTDGASENSLMVVAIFTNVIIVDTQVTQGAAQSAQANPQQTSPTADNGAQTAQPQATSDYSFSSDSSGQGGLQSPDGRSNYTGDVPAIDVHTNGAPGQPITPLSQTGAAGPDQLENVYNEKGQWIGLQQKGFLPAGATQK